MLVDLQAYPEEIKSFGYTNRAELFLETALVEVNERSKLVLQD